ncbi:MAG TPA: alanine/ornithine racemase family PLP-dependent enzyme [Thermotogota bacterium]|nr:alanine/ornithine racemase family PLP-dependent enzyme [Thermotogota bacterium]HRW35262.1 alanine/ornithine racemase family PLP-dependent enzyme [Thermotogota bacterium]
MFPKIRIDLKNIRNNAEFLRQKCQEHGVEIAAVTKVVCGNPDIAKELLSAGIPILADSRIQNIVRLRQAGIDAPVMLVRIPMLSEITQLIDHVDYVLVSENTVLQEICKRKGKKTPRFIFMVDVGDLREGVWFETARSEIEKAFKIAGDRLVGLGTNLGCFGGVIPSVENNQRLLDIAKDYKFDIISTGNTASLPLIENGTLPDGVNHFRLGESIMLGTDVTGSRKVPGTTQDTFFIDCEIIECDEKPSIPIGETGRDAFGGSPKFEDKGWRKRIILGIGGQDIDPSGLYPIDEKMKVLHASSDHTIVDVTSCEKSFRIGEMISFRLSYSALLRGMTSQYVFKEFMV